MKHDNSRILIISDTHFPFSHPDTLPFLTAIHKTHCFTRVIHIGDEVDLHATSYHEHDPDLLSAGFELAAAIAALKPLYKLFPVVDVLESNHGALFKRKAKSHGLPSAILRPNREILEAPAGWKWFGEITAKLPNGQKVYFCHGKSSNALQMSQKMGMCTVNGHFHTQFSIHKWKTLLETNWAMVVGCLIEPKSRAYDYQRNAVVKPIIGCGMILDSLPRLALMRLNASGRWTGDISG